MVVSRAVTIGLQLAIFAILTRILSTDDFATVAFSLLLYSTVLDLSQLGLPDSIFYFFERVNRAARKSFALATARTLFLLSLAGATVIGVVGTLAVWRGYEVKGLIIPLAVLVLLELPTLPLPNILIAVNKARQAAWINIIFGLAQFSAVALPGLAGRSVTTIIYCLLVYGILRFVVSCLIFFRTFPVAGEKLPAGMVREQLRYSVPLSFAQILWKLNRQIDKYFIAAFLSKATFAVYTVGAWEIPFIPAIAYSVAAVMMPTFVSLHLKQAKVELLVLWKRTIEKVSIVVLPAVVLALIAAEELITLLFTADYAGAALPFRIYTAIIIQRVAAYSSLQKAIGETKVITLSAIYLLVINLALTFPLVLWLGIAGPPLATLIANLFTWGYALTKIKQALQVTLAEVFPFASYIKTMFVAIVAGIPVLLVKLGSSLPASEILLLMAVSYFVSYFALASVSGVVAREDWIYLKKAFGKST